MNIHKKRLIVTAIITFAAITIVFACLSIDKASAKPFYYNQGWLPPRTHQICNDAFIGYEYQHRLEKRCQILWDSWTKEILSNHK